LPHQIKAVYGELLPRVPLRFLLADDPGAGKTIMAGLYIKELALRGDLARCLVVAPGGLVEQWQDELSEKLGMRFELLTADLIGATPVGERVFTAHPLLIARMDQLARNDDLLSDLERTDWDLVVVDEAYRMSAHYYGSELKATRRYDLGRLLGRVARHLLLMTATPHAGKEEDFQAFMALLDPDRYEGRFRREEHTAHADDLICRRVKEELLTFEGRPLFPERRASTVPYELSPLEHELYEAVTHYVRTEMNRADQLRQTGEGRRGNTVGFALTVLQRRLALQSRGDPPVARTAPAPAGAAASRDAGTRCDRPAGAAVPGTAERAYARRASESRGKKVRSVAARLTRAAAHSLRCSAGRERTVCTAVSRAAATWVLDGVAPLGCPYRLR